MTTQVQRLEERGWVTRVADPVDRRAVLISLTEPGRTLLDDVRRERAAVLAPYIEGLDAADRDRLVEAVATLTEILDADAAAAQTVRGDVQGFVPPIAAQQPGH